MMKREKTPWSALTPTVILRVNLLLILEMMTILEKVAKSLVLPWANRKIIYYFNFFYLQES